MRIALVAHGFPPLERTGVENHVASLAAALARAGHVVEVFVPRAAPGLPERSQRREERDGYAVTWVTLDRSPSSAAEHLDRPGAAEAFDEFLERERPELVHFHHVAKLGVGLIEVAANRGLPTIYTAHDYFAVCHRIALLLPDVSRCDTVGDPALCARCDSALSFLDGLERLGDYQAGALPDQLDEDERAALARVLAGENLAGEVENERRRLDARRAAVFAQLDAIFVPTRYVAERLVAGGIPADRIEIVPYAIDTSALEHVASVRTDGSSSLRFGFIGGLSKHKGAHVLLEAFARLRLPAQLTLFGDSSDREYVERVRARAAEVGAVWRGAFEARDLPRVLAEIDVLVVPSIWSENAPFVIREAFAARRPVIASRVGALDESVRDGVDGLLVEPGDPAALAEAMEQLAARPELLSRLSAGIAPVARIDDHVAWLTDRYARLRAERLVPSLEPLPAHLLDFVSRVRAFESLPIRELYARVASGLGELAAAVGELAPALPEVRASPVQDELRDRRREAAWLREWASAKERELEDAQRELGDAAITTRSLEAELEWLRGTLSERDTEIGWLRTAMEQLERDHAAERAEAQHGLASLHKEIEWRRELLAALESDRERLHGVVAGLEAERDALLQARAALERVEADRETLAQHFAALATHARWLESEGERASASLEATRRELTWRREQMDALTREGGAMIRAILRRSALGRRMSQWSDEPGDRPA